MNHVTFIQASHVPSLFCNSDIDNFLNYNNITHKLSDTHQARDIILITTATIILLFLLLLLSSYTFYWCYNNDLLRWEKYIKL